MSVKKRLHIYQYKKGLFEMVKVREGGREGGKEGRKEKRRERGREEGREEGGRVGRREGKRMEGREKGYVSYIMFCYFLLFSCHSSPLTLHPSPSLEWSRTA